MSFNNYISLTEHINDYENLVVYPYDNFGDNFDCEDSLMPGNQDQELIFNNINSIQNPDPIGPDEEEELNKRVYYYQNDNKAEDCEKLFAKLNSLPPSIKKEPELPKKEKKIQPIKKKDKETKDKVLSIKKKKKLFKEKIYRNDYLIKKFKTYCFSKYVTKKLKSMLKKCQFPGKLENAKVYLPDHKAFTAEANLKKNFVFLSMTLRQIYTMNSDKNRKEENKGKNEALFNKIDTCKNAKNPQAYEELKNYLNRTVEEVIIEFYGTDEFKNFAIKYEEDNAAFMKEKKFSFMENHLYYGFLKLIKNQY